MSLELIHGNIQKTGISLIEEYHPAGYDGPSGYRDFRVAPLNKKCRELNRKYILPFGYTLNKLFTSNWSEKIMME